MSATRDEARPGEYRTNRFHVLTLAILRARQLHAGARPRVPGHGHKPTRLALMEVMADTISWSVVADKASEAALAGGSPGKGAVD